MLQILIVDLCGTLICEDTTREFLRRLPLGGWRYLMRAAGFSSWASVLGRIMRRDLSRGLLVFALRGLSRGFLQAHAETYAQDRLTFARNSIVEKAIVEARSGHIPIYLATATLDPVADAVVQQLGLEGCVCSLLEYDSRQLCTGRFAVDITGRKWSRLCELFPLGICSATVYTDNLDDIDLIQRADKVFFLGERVQLSERIEIQPNKITFLSQSTLNSHACN